MENKSQAFQPNSYQRSNASRQSHKATQDYALLSLPHIISIIEKQKTTINTERQLRQEILSYVLWHRKIRANKYCTSYEKLCFAAYYDYMSEQPILNDGSRFYSLPAIEELMGEMGNFSKIHSKMKKYGIIKTHTKKQETDKNKDNYFDTINETFWTHPEELRLDDHSEWGGKHIILHKGCGGLCRGRMIYTCETCGEDYIEHKNIIEITEEEYEEREDLHAKIEDLEAIANEYSDMVTLSEMERYEDRSDIESFQEAMVEVRKIKRKQKFAMYEGTPLLKQEMTFYEQRRGP